MSDLPRPLEKMRERVSHLQIPHPFGILGKEGYGRQALPIPQGVTVDQAIAVIQNTKWAQDTANGVVDKLGLTGEQREKSKQAWANSIAKGMVRSMQEAKALPTSAPVSVPKRGRPPKTTPPITSTQETRKRPLEGMWNQRPRLFKGSR